MGQQANPGVGPLPDSECTITGKWIGRTSVITVSGALDALTAPRLQAAVEESMRSEPAAVIVDLSDVDFLSSAGMAVLVAARERADGGIGFGVVADGPATSRPLRLVGLADLVGLHPTLEEARAALGVS